MGLTDSSAPAFKLVANGIDITSTIKDRLVSLSLTDATGFDSDTLEITLADDKPLLPMRKPARGAELQLSLGYGTALTNMGRFVVDEIDISGWPRTMTVRGRGAPFDDSKTGATNLQTQKSRSWPTNTIKAIVSKIASEHGLEPVVSQSLESTQVPHMDQTAESDVSFLVRLAKRYDAMVKPAGGKLAFLKRGEQKTAGGLAMARIVVDAAKLSSWSYSETSRDEGGTVVAFWHSKQQAKRQQVEVGSGEPTRQLRQWYTNEAAANAAAQAEFDKRSRSKATLSVSLPGDPTISAECTLAPSGLHSDVPAEWLITRVTHRLGSDGYRCEVEAELPNAG